MYEGKSDLKNCKFAYVQQTADVRGENDVCGGELLLLLLLNRYERCCS